MRSTTHCFNLIWHDSLHLETQRPKVWSLSHNHRLKYPQWTHPFLNSSGSLIELYMELTQLMRKTSTKKAATENIFSLPSKDEIRRGQRQKTSCSRPIHPRHNTNATFETTAFNYPAPHSTSTHKRSSSSGTSTSLIKEQPSTNLCRRVAPTAWWQ